MIYRAEKLQEYFLNPEESFDLFDIQNMLSDQYITKEFCTIMNYPFGDIQKGKTIVDGILVEIPTYERMIWLLVNESQFTDTLSFNLKGYVKLIRNCFNFIKKYAELGLSDLKRKEFLEEFSHLFE